MADELRRWLELQRDLGGDELILDAPTDLRAMITSPKKGGKAPAAALAGGQVPAATIAASGDALDTPIRRAQLYPGGEPEFLKGAPEIPGRGMTIVPGGDPSDERLRLVSLEEVAASIAVCPRCALCRTRTNTVPGEGNPTARLMVVGEGPGETEDLTGRPFVGRAGELLDKMLAAIGEPRETVFIANVVKCRPPKNRAPLPDERDACLPYLRRQIALVRPKVILALGSTAAEALLGVKKPLGEIRLRVHQWDTIPLVVTYHPAALLRNPNWKRPAWDDVRIARQLLDATA